MGIPGLQVVCRMVPGVRPPPRGEAEQGRRHFRCTEIQSAARRCAERARTEVQMERRPSHGLSRCLRWAGSLLREKV